MKLYIGTHLFLLVLNNSKVGRAVNFPPKMIEKVCVQHCSLYKALFVLYFENKFVF